jgi:serine/threonine-protein kinase HipA
MKALFGVSYVPKINFSLAELSQNAQKMVGKLSISGVQPKLSLKLIKETKELVVVSTGGEFILKPQLSIYPNIPQNENLCMTIAQKLGIETPPHALMELNDGTVAYIVKRFDRLNGAKIHQEDFMQILEKEDKYKGSNEEIGAKISTMSDVPGLDTQLFYERVIFNFIIGNGDAHFKNYTMQYSDTGAARLSPVYDIVSSKLVISEEEDSALTINGKKNNLTSKDFDSLREYLKIPEKAVAGKFINQANTIIDAIAVSDLTADEKEKLTNIVKIRINRISKDG